MARTVTGSFTKVAIADLSTLHAIQQTPEQAITANCNEGYANWWPSPMVQQGWATNPTTPYASPQTTGYAINGIWRRRVLKDSGGSTVRVYCENVGGSQSATIKVDLASDAATYVDTTVIASGAAAAHVELDPGIDTGETRDTLRLYSKQDVNGAVLKIGTTAVEPTPLASIPAGVSPTGFVPFDTVEVAADAPLTPRQRQQAWDNWQIIRKTRQGDVVGFSDDWDPRHATAEAFKETSATYQLVASFDTYTPKGCTSVEWSCTGFRAGASGGVKVVIGEGSPNEDSQEQAFTTKAASPFAANIHDGTDLTFPENVPARINVYLKGDGTDRSALMGLCIWFGDAA